MQVLCWSGAILYVDESLVC